MKKQAFNPYLPNYEYVPDGEPYVFGDRVYVYGSHDKFNGEAFCMNDYVCWSAPVDALGCWRCEGVIYRKEQDPDWKPGNCLYAPDVTPGPDGRFYLYYTLDMSGVLSVAVADGPTGPFSYYGHVQYADGSTFGQAEEDIYQFDPGVLLDEDGRVWLYTGCGPCGPREIIEKSFGKHNIDGAFCVELEKDMRTVKSKPICIVPQFDKAAGTEFAEHPFFEASSIRKIHGRYYFVYSSTWSHELCYAVSSYPNRDFHFGGTIISNGDVGLDGFTLDHPANYIGNNHGGMVQLRDQWYIFYHRQTNYHGFSRQGCAERITIGADGSIPQVEMTSGGLNPGDLNGQGYYPAAIACRLYAAEGACFVDRAGENRALHPAFTQDGEDREQGEGQYITNLRNGAVAGFRYFDLSETTQIRVEVRGSAGKMLIYDGIGGQLLSKISFAASQEFQMWSAPLKNGSRHSGLFFVAETEGSLDFKSFYLEV